MIVVKVELWSAVTGHKTELARMEICNEGTNLNPRFGDYTACTLRGRSTAALDKRTVQRMAKIISWPRAALHVWNLVARALKELKYDQERDEGEGW